MEEIKNYIISQENTYKIPMEELQAMIRSGEAAKQLHAHDKIVLTFDGREELHEIIAIDAENLADKSLKHSITLQPVRLIGEPKPFDEDGKNAWSTSSIRKYLNSDEFITRYAEDMKKYVALVEKETEGDAPTVDRFFLLSLDEIRGGYPAFQTEKDRIKVDLEGETDWHFLRSAFRGHACNTWCVYASGYVYNGSAISAYRFAPACVIA